MCLVEFLLSLGDVRKRLGVHTALSQPRTEPQSRGGAGSRALVQHLLQSQKVGPLPQLGVTAANAWEGHQTTGFLLEISLWNGTCVPGALGPISQRYPAATTYHCNPPGRHLRKCRRGLRPLIRRADCWPDWDRCDQRAGRHRAPCWHLVGSCRGPSLNGVFGDCNLFKCSHLFVLKSPWNKLFSYPNRQSNSSDLKLFIKPFCDQNLF